jgi:ubiquinone/menaquinone biosynthesis C-methylase UbiE
MNRRIKALLKGLTPPLMWELASMARRSPVARSAAKVRRGSAHGAQELDIYWDPDMAELLETWGEDNAWREIRLLLAGRRGRVLDIACGTGKVMTMVQAQPGLEVHGCDISDFLIARAAERGLDAGRLRVCDATQMPYDDDFFDFAYSIGSLEHFTQAGIDQVLRGCSRVVREVSFHMVPVSRSGRDEGWITPYQGYFNNSIAWWTEKARRIFHGVEVFDSTWSDERSLGKWLVCARQGDQG